MNKKAIERAAYILGGAILGSVTTYTLVRKALALEYRDIAEEEIASVKESYDLLYKQGKYADPKVALETFKERVSELEDYADKLDENGYFKYDEVEEDSTEELTVVKETETLPDGRPIPEDVVKDILDERPAPTRDPSKPYVITVEEFMQDNEDYSKITVNYYEDDNTLASEDETIVHHHEKLIGSDFTNYVGWNAGSDHVVYVRNENMSSDFEVLVSQGGYAEEVLGILPDEHPKKKMLEQRNDE